MPATCGIFWMKGLIAKLERRTFATIAALPHWRMPLFTSRREQAVTFLHVSNDCESSVKNLQLPSGQLSTPFEASIVCAIVISAHVSSECVLPDLLLASLLDKRHCFRLSTLQAAVGCVQDFLILPAFFAWNRKLRVTFDRRGERVHLPCICISIRDNFLLNDAATSTKLDLNRLFNTECIFRAQHPGFTHDLERRAVFRTRRDQNRPKGPTRKLEGENSGGFHLSRVLVRHPARGYADDLITEDITQCVDTVHSYIGNGPATSDLGVG